MLIRFIKSVYELDRRTDHRLREVPEPCPPIWRIPIPQELKITARIESPTFQEIEVEEYAYCVGRNNEHYYLLKRYDAMRAMNEIDRILPELQKQIEIWIKNSHSELEACGKDPYGMLQFQNNITIPSYYNSLEKSLRSARTCFLNAK